MQPYTMVKDHRTNEETGNVSSVLDGNIDQFINAYLKQNSIQENKLVCKVTKNKLQYKINYVKILKVYT